MAKVAVIGARRRRQGIGSFVARWFLRAGADVCAVVGTSVETFDAAVADLASWRRESGLAGHPAIPIRGFADVEEALAETQPDIVAVCSPISSHREHLELVAAHGAHCLCEKPLWWEESIDPDRAAAETDRLVELFARQGKLLQLLAQWPHTLEAYDRLFLQEVGGPIDSFAMRMSPITAGWEMALDSASHPLSLLYARLGSGEVREVHAEFTAADLTELRLTFEYVHRDGSTACNISLKQEVTPPRTAGYAFNSNEAWREIHSPGYDMHLQSGQGERRVPMADPVGRLVEDLLVRLQAGARTDRRELTESMVHLVRLVHAAQHASGKDGNGEPGGAHNTGNGNRNRDLNAPSSFSGTLL